MNEPTDNLRTLATGLGLKIERVGSVAPGTSMWGVLRGKQALHGSTSLENIELWVLIYANGYTAGVNAAAERLKEARSKAPVVKTGPGGEYTKAWPRN